jgi:hypothetical protein
MPKMQWVLTAAGAILLLGTAAYAGNVHFVPQVNSPAWIDQGLTLNETGKIAGLGNGDVVINLSATADVTAVCSNQGGNEAPGQNPAPITVAGSTIIPEGAVKNGTVTFSVTTQAPATPIAGAPDCANPNWTESITDLAFTSARTTVSQLGVTELDVSCVFDPPTKNGLVPKQTVSCSAN